jgi:translation initiation factor eIF-2B subunit delta
VNQGNIPGPRPPVPGDINYNMAALNLDEAASAQTTVDESKIAESKTEEPKLKEAKTEGSKLDKTTTEEPKLSNAEKKKLAKAQKQAKRQARKVEVPGVPSSAAQVLKNDKTKQATNAAPSSSKPQAGNNQRDRSGSVSSSVTPASPQTDQVDKRVAMFKHLYPVQRNDTIVGVSKEVHQAVLAFGLQLSSYEITGSNARCIEMLQVFKPVSLILIPGFLDTSSSSLGHQSVQNPSRQLSRTPLHQPYPISTD